MRIGATRSLVQRYISNGEQWIDAARRRVASLPATLGDKDLTGNEEGGGVSKHAGTHTDTSVEKMCDVFTPVDRRRTSLDTTLITA
ncbi:hypothetical protein Tco_0673173 [Tanacetum coccineum]